MFIVSIVIKVWARILSEYGRASLKPDKPKLCPAYVFSVITLVQRNPKHSMSFTTRNPYTNETLETFAEHTDNEVQNILNQADSAFQQWRKIPFQKRAEVLNNAAELLKGNVDKYARTISQEMGKPIAEARKEVEKCAWVCTYYADDAEGFLQPKIIKTDAYESFVSYEPIGCVLAVMPWNYPFWQVFRFIAPTIMAGNVGVLKHAQNVLGSAVHMTDIFREAGLPEGVFQNIFAGHEKIEEIIGNDIIKAVTLTGSEKAGASVAATAGKHIKKSLLELGGSNAFVVLEDADLEKAVEVGVNARFMNTGQSCIAAKRFFIHESLYDEFVKKFVKKVKDLKTGNPADEQTEVGVLARKDLADTLNEQVQESVKMGAKILTGGRQDGAFYEPTVLVNVTPEMPVFREETFGPVAPIIRVKSTAGAFELARNTSFGLGFSVFTQDLESIKKYITEIPDGAFFVNDLVKSDPRLPFGGTKKSGYGRELSKDGIMEFMNVKAVYINK